MGEFFIAIFGGLFLLGKSIKSGYKKSISEAEQRINNVDDSAYLSYYMIGQEEAVELYRRKLGVEITRELGPLDKRYYANKIMEREGKTTNLQQLKFHVPKFHPLVD